MFTFLFRKRIFSLKKRFNHILNYRVVFQLHDVIFSVGEKFSRHFPNFDLFKFIIKVLKVVAVAFTSFSWTSSCCFSRKITAAQHESAEGILVGTFLTVIVRKWKAISLLICTVDINVTCKFETEH